MIPFEQLVTDRLYAVEGRNVAVAIFRQGKFLVAREKLGTYRLESEDHFEHGGTIRPLADFGDLLIGPNGIAGALRAHPRLEEAQLLAAKSFCSRMGVNLELYRKALRI